MKLGKNYLKISSKFKCLSTLVLMNNSKANSKPVTKQNKTHKIVLIFSFILKLIYSLLFLGSIGIFYFLIIISVEPRSFPIVTKYVEQYVNNNISYGSFAQIEHISIELNKLYKINVNLEDVELNLKDSKLSFENISAQFSILNFILYQQPNKIKFSNSDIRIFNEEINTIIDNIEKTKIAKKSQLQYKKYLKEVWNIFSFLKSNKSITKEIEIDNINLSFKGRSNIDHDVTIKYSDIKIDSKNDELVLSTKNIVNLNNNRIDIEFNANCQFDDKTLLKCDAGFFNLVPASFSDMFVGTQFLTKTNTSLSANINLEIDHNYDIRSILFNANSNKGNFHYEQFFEEKIDFTNLSIAGEVGNSLNNFKISNLKATFDNDIKFMMLMDIENINQPSNEKTKMVFHIANAPGNDIDKFWPVFLAPNIRQWVATHISKGKVQEAFANVNFIRKKGIKRVESVQSEVTFSNMNLDYSKDMPNIKNIDGTAYFSKNDMNIVINSAKVLKSKIKSANVKIDNFHKNQIILKILASVYGDGSDPLKHINYPSEFAKNVPNYINGFAKSDINIQIPLKNDLSLDESYIDIEGQIENINSKFLKDNSIIQFNVKKNFNSNIFKSNINFTNSNINLPILSVFKKNNIKSQATFNTRYKNNKLYIDNIDLIVDKNHLKSNLSFNLKPFALLQANINNNINKNNYSLNYLANLKELSHILKIKGQYLDLNSGLPKIINSNNNPKDFSYKKHNIIIDLKQVLLSSNQELNQLKIGINCINPVCFGSFIKSAINKKDRIDINLLQKSKNHNYSTISGKISNISALSRGLNISDQIINGYAKIKGKMFIDQKGNLEINDGNISIKDGLSIIKNDIFDQIVKEKTFEKLRSQIADSDKINFDKVNIDFKVKDNILELDKMIASNYFLGFTTEGKINLNDSSINLNGLIIPGYSVNKLFGIGDIPIISSIIVGEKGGGLFAARYKYNKKPSEKKGNFDINVASAIVPGPIRNLFGLFD